MQCRVQYAIHSFSTNMQCNYANYFCPCHVSYLCIFAGVAAWHHDSVTVMQYNNTPDPPVATFIILFLLADLHICGMFPGKMGWKEKDTDKYYNRTLRTHSTYLEIWLTRTPPRTRRKQSPGNDMKFLKRPPAMSAVSILSSVLFIFYMCNLSTLILSHLLHTYKDNLNPKLQSNS